MIKVYLAIPYSGMRPSSYYQATRAMHAILSHGKYNVFSPITHSHPMTEYGLPQDWEFWGKVDHQFLEWADEVWVIIPEEGKDRIDKSVGVQAEIEYANNHNMKVRYLDYQFLEKDLKENFGEL